MKLTLLVENNTELESFYSLNLQTWVGAKILPKKEAKFCLKAFEENPDIACIITKARNGLEKSAEALNEYLKSSGKDIPLIIIGKSSVEGENVVHLKSGLDIKPLMQNVAKAIGVTAQDMATMQVPEHFPIPINYFSALKRTITDVYEEDIDKPGAFKKKLNANEEFDAEIIKKYIQEGVANLYVMKNDRLTFVTNVTQELVAKIELEDLNDNEQIAAAEMGQQLLSQKLALVGITEETTKLANKQIKMMANNARKYPKMGKLLARLMSNKAGYLFKHGQILTYICNHMMENIDWGNADQKKKISFVAFFHDIMLQNDEQAMIHSEAELKNSNLDPKSRELVNKHAQLAAEMIQKYPHAPMGADQIIRQHHGITHGIGFSETYGGNLSPMTIVFIISEEVTDQIIRAGKDLNFPALINRMREKYPTQRFQKIIDIMEQVSL